MSDGDFLGELLRRAAPALTTRVLETVAIYLEELQAAVRAYDTAVQAAGAATLVARERERVFELLFPIEIEPPQPGERP